MEQHENFQDSVAIGYTSRRVWECACGQTEGYEIWTPLHPEEKHLYVIRDWVIERDWVKSIEHAGPVLLVSECLNQDCNNFCGEHEGTGREYPTAIIEKKIISGEIKLPSFMTNGLTISEN